MEATSHSILPRPPPPCASSLFLKPLLITLTLSFSSLFVCDLIWVRVSVWVCMSDSSHVSQLTLPWSTVSTDWEVNCGWLILTCTGAMALIHLTNFRHERQENLFMTLTLRCFASPCSRYCYDERVESTRSHKQIEREKEVASHETRHTRVKEVKLKVRLLVLSLSKSLDSVREGDKYFVASAKV